jgi:hypothetical protein
MAMNIDSVERALKKGFGGDLKYQVDREASVIRASWGGFTNYRDPNGDNDLLILVMLNANGEYLEIQAPHVYNAANSGHKGALSRVLLGTSLRTPLVQFSFDESDGEVRATAEMVLMDGTCTPKQLRTAIEILMNVIDEYHPHVVRAMETGEISYPDEGTIIRPTLEDSESEDGPLGSVDVDAEVRAALERTREAGKRAWESAAPARDPGRHA